ncbi:MAG: four helix bundle protein [bacterium]
MHKVVYLLGSRIPKRDRFGIHLKVDSLALECLELAITAVFETRERKLFNLSGLRIKLEVVKRLLREMNELKIIQDKHYLHLTYDVIEISKMTNGWIKYLQ